MPVVFMSTHHVSEYTVGQVIEQLGYGGFQVERILSRPISMGSLKGTLVRRLFAMLVSAVGSHHQLESTVFYLAKKSSCPNKAHLTAIPLRSIAKGEFGR
jgi:hypothetical protein